MNKQEQLAKAIVIAVNAHDGQFDKGNKPYILHPLHLMNQLMFDIQLATIAVLHSVIKASDITLDDLYEVGFSYRVLNALKLLNHNNESYSEYIEKIAGNYDTIRVKRKDLEHNSDITRLKGISAKDLVRIEKYHKAFTYLGEAKQSFERK